MRRCWTDGGGRCIRHRGNNDVGEGDFSVDNLELLVDFPEGFIVFYKHRARSARIGSARDFVPRKRPRVSGARKRFLRTSVAKCVALNAPNARAACATV